MIVSSKNEFIFFHNYKAAGASVQNALAQYGDFIFRNRYLYGVLKRMPPSLLGVKGAAYGMNYGHIKPVDFYSLLGGSYYKNYFTFGFVREPLEHAKSIYKYSALVSKNHKHSVVKYKTFDEFLLYWIDNKRLQSDFFMCPSCNMICVSKVYKMESMQVFENDFEKRFGIGVNVPKRNVSEFKDVKKVQLSDSVKEKFLKAYELDYVNFNYFRNGVVANDPLIGTCTCYF